MRIKSPSSLKSASSDFLTALSMESLELKTRAVEQGQLGLSINPEPGGETPPGLEKQDPTKLMQWC